MRFGIRWLLTTLAMISITGCKDGEAPTSTDEQNSPVAETGATDSHASAVLPDDDALYPPAPDLPPAPDTIRIAVISDVNGSYGSTTYLPTVHAAIQDIIRRKANIVISPGDLVAGQKPGLDYADMWRAFHFNIADVFFDNDIEFVWAPGNHDASAYPGFEQEREAYRLAWEARRPKAELLPGSHYPFYYAVIIRDILIVSLDITRPFSVDAAQLDWLETSIKMCGLASSWDIYPLNRHDMRNSGKSQARHAFSKSLKKRRRRSTFRVIIMYSMRVMTKSFERSSVLHWARIRGRLRATIRRAADTS